MCDAVRKQVGIKRGEQLDRALDRSGSKDAAVEERRRAHAP
jgi:hypothetical protein